MAEGNPSGNLTRTAQDVHAASEGLVRVRKAAERDRTMRFTTLQHHIDGMLLEKAYYALNRKAAVGVDGVTWKAYGKGLADRLAELHERLHSGRYRAQPSKRVWREKPDGRKRPIGIAALEDKIVQQALVWVLESIYEPDFVGFSYGFRPGRSQHNALDALHVAIEQRKVSWILDADLEGFFDSIDHKVLLELLGKRVQDQRILRLIAKFLRAGVSEDGEWSSTEVGTPQGAVLSPLLANVYLHYVLDLWVAQWRRSEARGEVYIIRYADDFVLGFQYRSDAETFREAVTARLVKHGLKLHPRKTRLIEFGRFAEQNRRERGQGKPESFDFLGFTHRCGRRRSDGGFTVRRTTIKSRMRSKLHEIRAELRRRMHHPVPQTGRWLRSVINGYLNYHAVPGNTGLLNTFRAEICRAWVRTLRRRSQKNRDKGWDRFKLLIREWIPSVTVRHPYPNQRLSV